MHISILNFRSRLRGFEAFGVFGFFASCSLAKYRYLRYCVPGSLENTVISDTSCLPASKTLLKPCSAPTVRSKVLLRACSGPSVHSKMLPWACLASLARSKALLQVCSASPVRLTPLGIRNYCSGSARCRLGVLSDACAFEVAACFN